MSGYGDLGPELRANIASLVQSDADRRQLRLVSRGSRDVVDVVDPRIPRLRAFAKMIASQTLTYSALLEGIRNARPNQVGISLENVGGITAMGWYIEDVLSDRYKTFPGINTICSLVQAFGVHFQPEQPDFAARLLADDRGDVWYDDSYFAFSIEQRSGFAPLSEFSFYSTTPWFEATRNGRGRPKSTVMGVHPNGIFLYDGRDREIITFNVKLKPGAVLPDVNSLENVCEFWRHYATEVMSENAPFNFESFGTFGRKAMQALQIIKTIHYVRGAFLDLSAG